MTLLDKSSRGTRRFNAYRAPRPGLVPVPEPPFAALVTAPHAQAQDNRLKRAEVRATKEARERAQQQRMAALNIKPSVSPSPASAPGDRMHLQHGQ